MDPIEFGPVSLYPFGLTLALALGVCVWWSHRNARSEAHGTLALDLFWLLALPLGLLGARLGYALCSLDMIEDEFLPVLTELPGSGFLFYGGLTGAACGLAISSRAAHASPAALADALAGPFLLFGAACALGEGLIGAGYGWKVEDWFQPENSMSLLASENPEGLVSFFGRFPFAVTDSFYGYVNWAVFPLMIVALLIGLAFLLRLRIRRPGDRAAFGLSLYAALRVLYESLRQDDIPKWGFVRINQVLSAALLLLLVLWLWRRAGGGLPASLALLIGGALLVGAMEFALEKKIGFLEWMPMDLCYLFSGAGCAMLFLSADRLRRRTAPARRNPMA